MTFTFPADKLDFTAPNGITYTHDGEKWRVKGYMNEKPSVDPETFTADQQRQDDALSAERSTSRKAELRIQADVRTEVAARERGESELHARIDEAIEAQRDFDPGLLDEKIEAEKGFRLEGDAKIAAGLVEEARLRADEDYKLLARINGLDIPEMPKDYDDSGLRELIEGEVARRATGDAALNKKIEDNTDKLVAVNEKVEAEKTFRVEGDKDLAEALRAENQERSDADTKLLARINHLEDETGRDYSAITVTPGEKSVWFEGDEPLPDPKERAGWFFETKDDPKSQAYYTIWSQESGSPSKVTLADLEALSIVLRNQGKVNPFIKIYTRRKNDRKDAASTYRSCVSYVCGDDLSGIPALTVLTTNTEAPLYGNLTQHLLAEEKGSAKGPMEDDEVISKIVVGTSSGKNAGDTKMLLEKFTLQTKERVDVVSLSIKSPDEPYDDSFIREDLEEEKALRASGDKALNAKIDKNEDKIVSVNEKLEKEKALRASGDQLLNTKLERTEDKIVSVNEKLEEEKGFRVEGDEALKKSLVLLEAQDEKIKADLEREKGFRVEGDQENAAAIESLSTQAENLRQADEVEKASRITEDARLAAGLVEEARTRADEDFKLLARINGLDIPEMPGDYEDSGLRELIEQEAALRITGDAGLNELIKTNAEGLEKANNDLAVERQDRAEADLKVQADVNSEITARKAGDSELHARIDELDIPEAGIDPDTFTADQKRQDDAQGAERAARIENDLKLAKELEDYKEEVRIEQEAQDQALEDYKAEVATEQAAQDEALEDLRTAATEDRDRQDQELEDFKGEFEQNKVDVAAEQLAQDIRLAALESSGG